MADAVKEKDSLADASQLPGKKPVVSNSTLSALHGISLRRVSLIFLLIALALGITAWLADDRFYLRLGTEALILSGLAMSVDVLLGFTGLLSLGQAMFFGFGAYVSSMVLINLAPSFWLAVGIALSSGFVLAVLLGVVANRVRGVYFALVTFALAQVVARTVYNTRVLGASDGLIGIPQIKINFLLFSVDTAVPFEFFMMMLVVITLLYSGISYLLNTPFGRTLRAIRENEDRVPFLGYNTSYYVLAAYVISAEIAISAGAFYPILRGFVSPELMFFQASGNAVINVIVGGVGTLIGPIIGTTVLTGLKSVVGGYTEHHLIIIGVLFMISVMFFPKGIVGYIQSWMEKRAEKRRGEVQ